MKKWCVLIVVFLVFFNSFSQKSVKYIGFYNAENLFDTINQSNFDEDFLPTGKNQWTSERYLNKLKNLNQAIDSLGDILVLGFAEIENRKVIEDLNQASATRKNFGIIHYDSPDRRGIDVAMIYDSTILEFNNSGKIVYRKDSSMVFSRDIVWGKFTYKKDTVFVLVNHWPSRLGGVEKTEHKRVFAAQLALHFIDSVTSISPKSKIVLMGDLNDYPTDKAPQLIAQKLHPMIAKSAGIYGGSYYYKGKWDVLDHLFVSSNVAKGKLKVIKNSGEIVSKEFLLEKKNGEKYPFRTFSEKSYLNGYSDHLPVKIGVRVK
ncbi:MAG: hypothetical protein M9916_06350 [Crocinitomicaceae bacterium]|nr:hypothetical protein [Crocinitomicaceae bacterium]